MPDRDRVDRALEWLARSGRLESFLALVVFLSVVYIFIRYYEGTP